MYASLRVWCCRGGGISSVTSKGPNSTRGSTGSWNWGRVSMLGSDSRDESKSITGGCGSVSSAELSEDNTIGALGSGLGCYGGLWRRCCRGRPSTSLIPRRSVAWARPRRSLANLLLSARRSRSLTGLTAAIARRASIAATRRRLVRCRLSGVPTMGMVTRPHGKPTAINQLIVVVVYFNYLLCCCPSHTHTMILHPPIASNYRVKQHSTRCAIQLRCTQLQEHGRTSAHYALTHK